MVLINSSILKYKKMGLYLGTSSPWTLSKIVDDEAIEAANKEVTAVLKMPTRSVIILTLSPEQKASILHI